jgi:hypothetical protein
MRVVEQERKTERVGLAVTPTEREAIRVVAAARDLKDDSLVLRQLSLNAVVKEYRRLRRVMGVAA